MDVVLFSKGGQNELGYVKGSILCLHVQRIEDLLVQNWAKVLLDKMSFSFSLIITAR